MEYLVEPCSAAQHAGLTGDHAGLGMSTGQQGGSFISIADVFIQRDAHSFLNIFRQSLHGQNDSGTRPHSISKYRVKMALGLYWAPSFGTKCSLL